jgi:hypothetical protein
MLRWLANATMASTRQPARYGRVLETETSTPTTPPVTDERANKVSVFIDPKALTYPVSIAVVKAIWEGLKTLPSTGLDSPWVPFALCLILAALITISNLTEESAPPTKWIISMVIGLLNGLVLYAAVMGVS